MRHRKKGKKLSRNTKARKALFRDLINALILNEQIKTTETKAKVLKRLIDKWVKKAQLGTLSARRKTFSVLQNKKTVHKLFEVIGPRTKKRMSGFTTLHRLGRRRGDNTMMARVEFVDKPAPEKSKKTKTKTKKK